MNNLTFNTEKYKQPLLTKEAKDELRALRDRYEAEETPKRCQKRLDFKFSNIEWFGRDHYNIFKRDGFYYIVTFPKYYFSVVGTTAHHCRFDETKLRPDQIEQLEKLIAE